MNRPGLLAVCLLALLGVAACTSSSRPSAPPPSPQVRCLSNPRETGTRPLIFFFCVESP